MRFRRPARSIAVLFCLVLLSCPGLLCLPAMSQQEADSDQSDKFSPAWKKPFQEAVLELGRGNASSSEALLDDALLIAKSPEELKATRQALALAHCEKAVDLEVIEEEKLTRNKRDILYLVVIAILASWLFTFLMRHGPQKMKSVERAERWVARKLSRPDTGAPEQMVASFAGILIFGVIATVLLGALIGFMWLIALVGPPSDGQYDVSRDEFRQAGLYFDQAEGTRGAGRLQVLKAYRDFLEGKGRTNREETVREKIELLQNARKAH